MKNITEEYFSSKDLFVRNQILKKQALDLPADGNIFSYVHLKKKDILI